MQFRWPILALFAVFWLMALIPCAAATDSPVVIPTPKTLPKYDLDIKINTAGRLVTFRSRVTWTNTTTRPTNKLVFNFYPHYRIPDGEYLLLAKTLELLRLNPSEGIEQVGGHGRLDQVLWHAPDNPEGKPLALVWQYREDQPTVLTVDLPQPVQPGEQTTVDLIGQIRLADKQGRWGQYQGVTFLTHALPMLSYCDDDGWKETPFVPWHQPFWNEAGVYRSTVTLPADELLACSAEVDSTQAIEGGWKQVRFKPFVGRDFALTCSKRYREYRSQLIIDAGHEVELKCLAFPEHEFYAKEMLRIVAEAIPIYSRWFGPYPYRQFTIAESYFGWNGNECSGMILIDERVFAMPELAKGYVEYLVSHETCHQWWYNLVGTNGYSETWIDEGAATYFTHRLLDKKLGQNNEMLNWPGEMSELLPNIKRENYRYAPMYGAIRRGDMPAAAGDLPEFGHLYGLFTGAYDRGSKVFEMIEHRLGEAAFFEFIQGLIRKYSFRVLSGEQFQKELEVFTGKSWQTFFDQWVYDNGMPDWSVESVEVKPLARLGPLSKGSGLQPPTPVKGTTVEVVLRQRGTLDAPTTLGFEMSDGDGYSVRVPILGQDQPLQLADYDTQVKPLDDGTLLVRVTLPGEPQQVTVDPDRILLDCNPGNNSWKNPPRFRVTPFYSLLNETDLTNDWDRWNFAVGPWFWGPSYEDPWYTRSTTAGVRAGAYRTQTFAGGVYAGFRSDYRDLVLGADGLFDHWPHERTQVGFNVEQRIGGPYFGEQGPDAAFRGVLFGRYVKRYGSSLYLPPIEFVDLYTTYQDNFLPFARNNPAGSQRPSWWQLTGLHYRLNLYTPYWDPERGFWIDLTAAGGVAELDSTVGMFQSRVELAAARKLPDGMGYWSDVRVAGRVVVEGALPDEGQFFALGGGTLYRGFDLSERQGSFLWVINQEVRMPVLRRVQWDAADHVIGLRNLYAAGFADIGSIYTNGRSVEGTAYALGVGLRADLAIFSFIERATVRVDVAKTINAATPFQVWFGLQHPF